MAFVRFMEDDAALKIGEIIVWPEKHNGRVRMFVKAPKGIQIELIEKPKKEKGKDE